MLNKISFRVFKPFDSQTLAIERHTANFSKRFPHISSLCLVVTHCGNHHSKGEVFDISLRVRLPTGKKIDFSSRLKDDRCVDLYFTLNDVFKRARRQLKDKSEKLRGDFKNHVMPASNLVSE